MIYSIIYGFCAVMQFICFSITQKTGTKVLYLIALILFAVAAILHLK